MLNRIESFQGSRHFRLQYVADSTVAAVAVPGTGSLANAAIIDLGGLTLVVDTFATLEAAQDLKAAAEHLTGNPVSYVINTHWHSDHTTGNQVFALDAQLIATSETHEIMNTFARDRVAQYQNNREKMLEAIEEAELQSQQETDTKLQQEMAWENATDREFVNMLPQLVHTVPTITFDRQMTIHGSNRSAQLITYGGGHTQSDAIVYLPEDKIVIIGDLVLSNHHPVLANANPQEWLHILEQIERLDVETIIPGHGEVCSLQQLHEVKGYISRMIAIVTEAVQNQQSIEEIEIPEEYRAWYFTTYFKTNLNKLYDLITA
ncbi:MBL fold metallo-hydrolase [Paenibacillus silagei]|uniref:Glyoxylase-like metal-dependent hydrolase (Beta-lactamase superfamily II) n=1 Tax=Paenibacillus silagei TaxID=1670801 RepID=A0ABS4NRD1_9BACL|nr:MBL fold metallo-hydrolase [Paenibacillus silagei]MBP2111985.1 glyoxylase-like metal-dependent hydrolase (beta-lactamase superfamily II) [Paenibacillus silagei]